MDLILDRLDLQEIIKESVRKKNVFEFEKQIKKIGFQWKFED